MDIYYIGHLLRQNIARSSQVYLSFSSNIFLDFQYVYIYLDILSHYFICFYFQERLTISMCGTITPSWACPRPTSPLRWTRPASFRASPPSDATSATWTLFLNPFIHSILWGKIITGETSSWLIPTFAIVSFFHFLIFSSSGVYVCSKSKRYYT